MLYRLYSFLTNLHISFHHQSDVLLQQGTPFMKLLLSPEIRYAMEKKSTKGTSGLRSTRPNLVLVLATQCLKWGGDVRGQWGCRGHQGHGGLPMKNKDGLLQSTLENCRQSIADNSTWAQVNEAQVSTLLATRCLYLGHWGGIWGWWVWQGTSDKTSSWPTGWSICVMLTCSSTTLDYEMPVLVLGWGVSGELIGGVWALGVTYEKWRLSIAKYSWKFKTVYCEAQVSTTLGHQMPLPGDIEGEYGGDGVAEYIWQNIVLTHSLMRCYANMGLGWGCQGTDRELTGGVWGIGGYIWKMKTVYWKVLMKTQDSLLQTIEYELRSMGPKFVPVLATRCLYQGVCLTESQSDPKANQMSRWPDIVLSSGQLDLCQYHSWPPDASTRGVHLTECQPDPKDDQNVKITWCSTIIGHQMPLPGGYILLNVSLTQRMTIMSKKPDVVPFLATRCLYQGVCLTECQPEPKDKQMSRWPDVVPFLATRCLYQGVCLTDSQSDPKANQMSRWPDIVLSSGQLDLCQYHSWPPDASTRGVHLTECQPDPKDDQNVKITWCSTILGHQMPLPGGMSDWMSAWPKG